MGGVRKDVTETPKARSGYREPYMLSRIEQDSSHGCCAAYDITFGSSTDPDTTSSSPSKARRTFVSRQVN